jgi:hypothetical protein
MIPYHSLEKLVVVDGAPKLLADNKGETHDAGSAARLDPESVDFSDPALPPGMTAQKVRAGIAVALKAVH